MRKKCIIIGLFICVIMTEFSLAGEKDYLKEYSDVSTWHWAYETIQKLSSKGIISGYPDGSFKPSNTITRAEATKLIMTSLNPNAVLPYGITVCPDVQKEHWASRYIINGKLYVVLYDDGTFKPEKHITRLEFTNAVAKCLEFANYTINPNTNTNVVSLKDISDLDEKSIENIKFLVKLGIINGYEDQTFRPNGTLTRAEACKVLSLALIYKEAGLNDALSKTDSWVELDTVTGWNSPLGFDKDGNIKFFIKNYKEATQLYYNGEYFMTPNQNISTVKQEILYTPDGKEWNVKWFGENVVECTADNNKYKLINHYQDKEYIFDSKYIKKEKAIKILEELFPYQGFDFIEKDSKIVCDEYNPNNSQNIGYIMLNNSYVGENNQIWISIEDLKTVVWSEEVNGNTQSRIEWLEKSN